MIKCIGFLVHGYEQETLAIEIIMNAVTNLNKSLRLKKTCQCYPVELPETFNFIRFYIKNNHFIRPFNWSFQICSIFKFLLQKMKWNVCGKKMFGVFPFWPEIRSGLWSLTTKYYTDSDCLYREISFHTFKWSIWQY